MDDACSVNLRKSTGELPTIPDDQVRRDEFSCAGSLLNALGECSATEILEDEILDGAVRTVIVESDDMVVVPYASEQIGFAFRSVWVEH